MQKQGCYETYTENIAPRGVDVKEIQAAKARET